MLRTLLCITDKDLQKLRAILKMHYCFSGNDVYHLRLLESKLNRAKIIKQEKIPGDIVTMNTEIACKILYETIGAMERNIFRLVYPGDAEEKNGNMSVLGPVGMDLLGAKTGDTVQLRIPAMRITMKVEAILYQPEAAGHYSL